jgi:hypothetical protein
MTTIKKGICSVCGEEKPTCLAAVHVYRDEGQPLPVLQIQVCDDCLSIKRKETRRKEEERRERKLNE